MKQGNEVCYSAPFEFHNSIVLSQVDLNILASFRQDRGELGGDVGEGGGWYVQQKVQTEKNSPFLRMGIQCSARQKFISSTQNKKKNSAISFTVLTESERTKGACRQHKINLLVLTPKGRLLNREHEAAKDSFSPLFLWESASLHFDSVTRKE